MKSRILKCIMLFITAFGLFSFSLEAQELEMKITGKVIDISGEPLIGVSIQEVGTTTGTVTDIDGEYTLGVTSANSVLKFTYIGFEEQHIKVDGRRVIEVKMVESSSELDEVVVIGYGTSRRSDLTGSVSSISTAGLENERSKNLQQILRGNIPGLNVGIATSAKGNTNIQIRGRRSLSASSTPLIVLDGVIYNGDLADINPNDIQNIDVLKDASSAAVYGAKSANGVVIVTTKAGKTEKPTIGFSSSLGITSLFRSADVYGPTEFIDWRSDVLKSVNRNAPAFVFENPKNLPAGKTMEEWLKYDNSSGDPQDVWLRRLGLSQVERDNYSNDQSTDWMKMVYGTGFEQSYNVNLSGRTEKLNYYWSLGHDNNEGVVKYDDYTIYRSRLRLNATITDFLSVGVNTQFSMRKESGSPASWAMVDNLSPWGQPTNLDGSMKIYPTDDAVAAKHPLIDRAHTSRDYTYKSLDNSIFAKITLPWELTYELRYSPRFTNNELYQHNSSEHPEYGMYDGRATRNTSSSFLWQVDNIVSWKKNINNIHDINITLLANSEKNQDWSQIMTGEGFVPNDVLGYHNIGAATIKTISSNDTYSTGDAYMARLFYSLKSRYLFTGTVRRDGYSAFGLENPRATFPSLALAWVFSEESFINNTPWLDYGKLRLSWGQTGNRSIGIYNALSTLGNAMITYVDSKGSVYQESYLNANRMGNRQLRWENTSSFNFGLDFSLFAQRINGSIELYSMNTTDLLVNRSLPSVTGFASVTSNLGRVNNKGLEFNLNSKNINTPNFSWDTSFNISYNKNEIKSLYGDMEDILDESGKVIGRKEVDDLSNGWFIGRSIDEIWDYKVLGVWQESESVEAAEYGLAPGDFKLEDLNDDGVFTNDDKQFLGLRTPPVRWSIRNNFTFFNNFDLSFLIYSNLNYKREFEEAKHNPTMTLERFNSFVVPYWTPDNPNSEFARLNSNMAGVSYKYWQDMSFLRLDNISVGYTFTNSMLKRMNLADLRLSLSARNVALLTKKFVLWDPEYAGPTPSYVTFGLNFTL